VEHGPRPSSLWLLLAIAGTLVALLAWGFTFVAASFICSQDTSECADNHDQRDYRGRLFDYEGRPAAGASLVFGSGLYGDHRERFRADEQGRFCVTALPGSTSSFISVEGQEYVWQLVVRSSAPVDPRFADPAVRDELSRQTREYPVDRLPFIIGEPYPNAAVPSATFGPLAAHDATTLWDAATDATPTCRIVGASPAWYRFEDHRGSWQFVVLNLAPVATVVLLFVGIDFRRAARWKASPAATRRADRMMWATCLAAALTAALTFALWTFT
jgi:hypothetical protein